MARIQINDLAEDMVELDDDMLDDVAAGNLAFSPMLTVPIVPMEFGMFSTGDQTSLNTFGAGSTFSDRRLKAGIRRTGQTADGVATYSYRYIWDAAPRGGVMADVVARRWPGERGDSEDTGERGFGVGTWI